MKRLTRYTNKSLGVTATIMADWYSIYYYANMSMIQSGTLKEWAQHAPTAVTSADWHARAKVGDVMETEHFRIELVDEDNE